MINDLIVYESYFKPNWNKIYKINVLCIFLFISNETKQNKTSEYDQEIQMYHNHILQTNPRHREEEQQFGSGQLKNIIELRHVITNI